MTWQFTPFSIPLIMAGVLSAMIAWFAWGQRRAPGAIPLAAQALAAALWSLGYACELNSADLATSLFWAKAQYLGTVVLPVAWLAFVLQYTDRQRWLTRRTLASLAIMPAATLLLTWTNERHLLIWRTTRMALEGTLLVLQVTHGIWFWAFIVYSYLCLLAGTVLLIGALARAPQLYRGQVGALMVGITAPWLGNALYVAQLSPWPSLDLTPFGFTLAGLALAWGFLRYRLLDLVPVARAAVIEGMDDAVIVLDAQQRVVDLNPAALAIVGGAAARAIGQHIAQVFARWPDLVERYEGVEAARHELIVDDGPAQHWLDLRIAPMRDRRGRLSGRLVVMRDISDRKRAEAALLAQKRLFERLVAIARQTAEQRGLAATLHSVVTIAVQLTHAAGGSLALIDPAGAVALAMRAGDEPQAAQHAGAKLPAWVYEQRRPALIADALRDERQLPLADAPTGIGSALVTPIASQSQLLGVLTLHHGEPDHFGATDLELMQAATDQLALALRNALLHEERELLLAQLTQAKESAEAANLAKSEFIGFVSHELRTPVSIVKGYADLLTRGIGGAPSAGQLELLGTISTNADLMATLIGDLADLARIEAGQLRLDLRQVAFAEIAAVVLGALGHQIEQRAQTVTLELPDDLPPMLADRTRLTQVVANLVGNAHKYTPAGGRIAIRAGHLAGEPGGAAIWVTVQDSGIGISAAEQPRIFERFFRAADPQAREAPGTGLGLSITKQLVELQGGRIWFESALREGSAFHFTIPAALEPAARDAPLEMSQSAS